MKEGSLGKELRDFIATYIFSVEQLEILQFLCERPDQAWTCVEVLQRVQSSEASVAHCLESFLEQGLLQRESTDLYRYRPRKPQLADVVSKLLKAYQERRVAVIEAIYSNPVRQIQGLEGARKRTVRQEEA